MFLSHIAALLVFAIVSLLPLSPERLLALTAATQDSVHNQIDTIQDRVVVVRDLKPLNPIERDLMSREDLRAYLENSFYEDVTPEDIESNTVRWELLGYIPPGVDLLSLYVDVLTEQVLGFYTLDKKSLFLISEQQLLTASDELTVAHELAHALQDQHFDLEGLFDAAGSENDLIMALQALAEGDAVLASLLYGREFMTTARLLEAFQLESTGGSSSLDSAPLVVRRELLFPYTSGVDFIAGIYAQGQWAAVNQVWDNPPQSTEQVLHPERYAAGDAPIELALPDVLSSLGEGWRLLEENTNGELDWNILIEQYVDAATATTAAGGWGGDRFQVFKRDADGAAVFAARTAWDSDVDAQQFFTAMQQVVSRRHGESLQINPPRTVRMTSTSAGQGLSEMWEGQAGPYSYAMELEGSRMTLVISTGPAAGGIATSMGRP